MIKTLTAAALVAGFAVHPAASTINVSNVAQLIAALKAAKPGDTIQLADGDYGDQFVATTSGTASAPITLVGSAKAVLHDPKFNPGDTDCPSGQTGYGLWLQGASYWNLKGFSVTQSKKGIVLDGAAHVTIDSVSVHDIGYEGVHFRKSSAYGVIKNSTVYNTGLEQPGYGEGVYIGSANSNWACYGANGGKDPDAGNYVQVLNNKIGPNVAAEGIDVKEGTHDGLISGNTLDGAGEKNENSGDSTMDIKGDKYTVTGNTVRNAYLDGIQLHSVWGKTGCGNTFSKNTLTVTNADGYGINATDQSQCVSQKSPNVIGASNKSTGGKGLSKTPTTPGV
ncbi:right-handed parallel beta-helix repeat-containing protein [Kutzneria sp. CA-103260]|uniref:right-handed parallel beta-helix repeat-containing protein n=1 Tax=Kutzneria sp. CA-103260 TaxID=2802641 RepID=UPI001BA5B714|nr:right-handed parallel beta-helix repeat-containing protein [Kutzneria sp. CA-103260]QUQ63553.1 Right handed beta helix region [Kutzneria sp. CA-103260]